MALSLIRLTVSLFTFWVRGSINCPFGWAQATYLGNCRTPRAFIIRLIHIFFADSKDL